MTFTVELTEEELSVIFHVIDRKASIRGEHPAEDTEVYDCINSKLLAARRAEEEDG